MQLDHETTRLSALRRYGILDTPPEEDFDRITAMGARLFDVAVTCITLVDKDRFFFKSTHGVDVQQLERQPGFCDTTIQQKGVYCIEDTAKEPLVMNHPLVSGEPHIRFYAGSPLRTCDGFAIGTLCIFDPKVRSFTEAEKKLLQELSEFVMFHLDRRRLQAEFKQQENRMSEIQKLEGLGMLAGGIAHDFNNLLVGILGNASLAKGQVDDGSAVQQMVQKIICAADQAKELTGQLLAYAGERAPSLCPIDMSQLVADMEPLIRSAVAKDIVLKMNSDSELDLAMGDTTQIRQVILNLVSNAAESYNGSSGDVDVRLSSLCVSQSAADCIDYGDLEPGSYVRLEVIDHGRGMNEESLRSVYDPFYTTKNSGRGLGMSIVQRIVRGHRGLIQIESSVGNGCRVSVDLPAVANGPVDVAVTTADGLDASLSAGTILVVEDNDLVAEMADSAIRHLGFDVITAVDGTNALECLNQHLDVDALLLDATLPGMSSTAILDQARRLRPNLPTVVTSGHDAEEVESRFSRYEKLTFLSKPWTIDGLASAIRVALAKD